MKFRYICIAALLLWCSSASIAQVQVRDEPVHRPVFQNKYIRLLDVWLPPGDTTLYHIHSTPSVFVVLSNALTASQIKGEEWTYAKDSTGKSWYRSFSPDSLIHRVANIDTVPFHVNDIEMLAPYNKQGFPKKAALPLTVMYENESVISYQVKKLPNRKENIQHRGPLLAELIKGDGIVYHDMNKKKSKSIKEGSYLYIEPETSFYFTTSGSEEINLLLFEFK